MNKIPTIIEKSIEPTEPQFKLLAWLKANAEGKLLTEPLLKKMQAAVDESLRIQRRYGMTHIEWGDYGYHKDTGRPGGSIILAWSEKNVRIDTKLIEEKNAAYFSACLERNETRRKALADEKAMYELDQTLKAFVAYRDKIKELMAHGTVFAPDRYTIEKEYGLAKD